MARRLTRRLEALEASVAFLPRRGNAYAEAARAVECMNEASGLLYDPDFLDWAASELRDGPQRYTERADPCEEPERWALGMVLVLLDVADANGLLDNPPEPPDLDALGDVSPDASIEDIPREVGEFFFWLPALWMADALGLDGARRALAEAKRDDIGERIRRGEL